MGWAKFWPIFQQTHLVTLLVTQTLCMYLGMPSVVLIFLTAYMYVCKH
jgi:hypothetical protein